MEQVRFCRHCGELVDNQWLHCPWCGEETFHKSPEWHSVVNESLNKAEVEQQRGNLGVLDDLSGRLDALESELDAFLAGRR